MRRWLRHIVAFMVVSPAVAASAAADVVEMKAGERVEGVVSQVTSSTVSVEVGGQTLIFERDKVKAIHFGGGAGREKQDQSSALHEAVKALKALDSAVGGGVTYRDYSSRVIDAKIIVDRFVDKPEATDPETIRIVRRAMAYHVAASAVWNAKVSNRLYSDVDRVVYECVEAKEMIRQGQEDRQVGGSKLQAGLPAQQIIANFGGLPLIWRCAARDTADATRRVSER